MCREVCLGWKALKGPETTAVSDSKLQLRPAVRHYRFIPPAMSSLTVEEPGEAPVSASSATAADLSAGRSSSCGPGPAPGACLRNRKG